MALTPSQISHISLWVQLVLEISETILTSSQLLITGSTRTESTTNIKPTFVELRYTCSAHCIMQVLPTLADSMLWPSLEDWMDGLDTIEILISKSTFPKFLPERSCKLFGMELQSLSEDWQLKKSTNNKTNTPNLHFWTLWVKFALPQQVILKFWCALLSVLIWDVFQSLTLVPTTVGSAFVTAQSTINTEEFVKVLPC